MADDDRPIARWIKKAEAGSIEHALTLLGDFADRVDAGQPIPAELAHYFADCFGQILDACPALYEPPDDKAIAAALNLKRPKKRPEKDNGLRDMALAIRVKRYLDDEKISDTQAIVNVSADTDLSETTVRNAWKNFRLRRVLDLLTEDEKMTLIEINFQE